MKLITKNKIKNFVKQNGFRDFTKEELYILYNEIYKEKPKSTLNKKEIWQLICKGSLINKIYERYKKEKFGVSTFEVEEMLGIDKVQRKKLEKKNVLKVAYTKDIKTQGGFYITAPYYSLDALYTLDKEEFYLLAEKCKKKKATEKQLKALEKAREVSLNNRTCNRCGLVVMDKKELTEEKLCSDCNKIIHNKREAIKTIKNIFSNKDKYVILDTETTGLKENDKVIELGIINLNGEVLIDTRIKTDKDIDPGAYCVHGISKEDLESSLEFKEIINSVEEILKDKTALIFNSAFDVRMLKQTGYTGDIKTICLMYLYMDYTNSDTWVSLSNAMKWEGVDIIQDHSAIGDCLCCLELIKAMIKENI